MQKLDLSQVPKLKPNPLFKGLSSDLKDPKNYKKVEKKLQAILKTDHTHKSATSYAKCKACNLKREERQKVMKEIGFKSLPQYLEWKKIMVIIINKANFQLR